MDELNLAERFGGRLDERMPVRRKKKKTIPGIGMEKPKVRFEDEEESGFPGLDEELGLEDEDLDIPEEGEDEVFDEFVDQMRGGSASAGRAAERRKKLKGKLPPRPREDEEEE